MAGCTPDEPFVEDGKVIVLMYHRISEGEPGNLYERSLADLESDLVYLQENDIRVIDFNDLEEMVNKGKTLHHNYAILTFDDGDHSWFTRVRPLLVRYKMCATLFLWVSMIEEGRDSFLSWDEVELMSSYIDENGKRPFTFGSHTLYHQYLYDRKIAMDDPEAFDVYLDEELGGSRNLILKHTPVDVNVLSLPYGNGAGDADIITGAERNGYKIIRTSEWGAIEIDNLNLMRIPSLPILDDTEQTQIGTYLGIE